MSGKRIKRPHSGFKYNLRTELTILSFFLMISLCLSQDNVAKQQFDKEWHNIPVLKLNFYMMGMDTINQELTLEIGSNVEYLNQEFEGQVKFILNDLIIEPSHAYIPDLHAGIFQHKTHQIRELVRPIERKGAINIYLFETYSKDGKNSAMMGFTPILRMKQSTYSRISPRFDRIFIAYPGLADKSTLVHEMGHFLGLQHPWEMPEINKELMGLTSDEKNEINHMTYNLEVSEFTQEQLQRMRHFALTFRSYLLKRIERQYH